MKQFGKHKHGVFYPSDEELIRMSGGIRQAKYFVTYANDTKMQTFGSKKKATEFIKMLGD